MSTGKESEVRNFLLSVKFAIRKSGESRGWTLSIGRKKNMDTMTSLGMTLDDVEKEILSLSTMDYCSGPLKDPKISGDVWVFGKTIRGKEIYIKLKLLGDHRGQWVRVLSFHPPERPLSYFFKNK